MITVNEPITLEKLVSRLVDTIVVMDKKLKLQEEEQKKILESFIELQEKFNELETEFESILIKQNGGF